MCGRAACGFYGKVDVPLGVSTAHRNTTARGHEGLALCRGVPCQFPCAAIRVRDRRWPLVAARCRIQRYMNQGAAAGPVLRRALAWEPRRREPGHAPE